MFDLSMKDKPRSPFGKLKDKVKGRKKYDLESASAIIPSSTGALDMEEDYELGGKKAKSKGFFFKNKLRKSSLTQSNTSLGSDSTVSSGSVTANQGAGLSEVTRSPSRHSSLSTERSVKDYLPSPKLTHKRAFSDEVSQVNVQPEPKAIQSLKPKNDPVSRSSLCVNGSHVYSDEPTPKPSASVLQSSLPPPTVPQNIPKKPEERFGAGPSPESSEVPLWAISSFEKAPQRDPPRFIPSPPILAAQEEDKVSIKTIALNKLHGRAKAEENLRLESSKPIQIATPMVFSSDVIKVKPHEETRKEEKRAKTGFFHHGGSKGDAGSRSLEEKTPSPPGMAGGDEKSKIGSWFGSKDSKESSQKPSFPSGPLATTEVTGSLYSTEDQSPSSSVRLEETQASSPAQNVLAPVPDPSPTAAAPPPFSEWDDTFDAFAVSRIKPEAPNESTLTFGDMSTIAYIDDAGWASQSKSLAEVSRGSESGVTQTAEWQAGDELCVRLGSWSDVSAEPRAAQEGAATGRDSPEGETPKEFLASRTIDASPTWSGRLASGKEEEWTAQDFAEARPARETLPSNAQTGPRQEETVSSTEGAERTTSATGAGDVLMGGEPHIVEAKNKIQESRWGRHLPSDEDILAEENGPVRTPSPLAQSSLETPAEEPPQRGLAVVPALVLKAEVGGTPWKLAGGSAGGSGNQEQRVSVIPLSHGLQVSAWQSRVPEETGEDGRKVVYDDLMERHAVSSPWTGAQEPDREGECEMGTPPPKPPRQFTPWDLEEEANEADGNVQQGDKTQSENKDVPTVETRQQSPLMSRESSPPMAPGPPALGAALIDTEDGSAASVTEEAEPAAEALVAYLKGRANESASQDASSGENQLELNEAEQFETCPSEFSVDGLGLSGTPEASSELGVEKLGLPSPLIEESCLEQLTVLHSTRQANGTELEVSQVAALASEQPKTPRELDSAPPVVFWTALEEQQELPPVGLGHGQVEELALSEGTSELGPKRMQGDKMPLDGDEAGPDEIQTSPAQTSPPGYEPMCQEGLVSITLRPEEGGSSASELELSSSWSPDKVVDYKKADFWQLEGGCKSSEQANTSTVGNPFAPLPSPSTQNNPFVEKLPDVPSAPQASSQGGSRVGDLQPETAPHGLLPANPLRDQLPPSLLALHGNQPLAFSTPSLQAATNPKKFDFPSPIGGTSSGEISKASSQAAAQPSQPLLQAGGADASTLAVFPKERQLAEKPFLQQTTSFAEAKRVKSHSLQLLQRGLLEVTEMGFGPEVGSGSGVRSLVYPSWPCQR
uniref:Uncharacterized protein n=1 Tax=Sphenodon punctatus TaxID=8508 RepID=A0A8D0G929_SPHPU